MNNNSTHFTENRDPQQILGDKLFNNSLGLLGEFFEISDKAQEGGMGEVFFCRDKRDNKFYVLKSFNDKSKNIFKEEAIFALNLEKNPYVVYTRTIISDNSKYYVVMDYIGKQPYNVNEKVEGETLSKVIQKHQLEPKQALIWAIQFCKGMNFLNKSGMKAHKDIKPDNILISPDNVVKIIDFSLASIEKKGGTPGYIPPEYSDPKKELTIRSDIFSFGKVLYQMLNNGKLLSDTTKFDKEKKEYESFDYKNITSKHCQDIIRKCLQRDITKRYNDFEELEKDLIAYLKQNYPEYQLPKLKAEEMTANEYFLKGLGYYVLDQKTSAFHFCSKAISKDKNFAAPYYFRYLLTKYLSFPMILTICASLWFLGVFLLGLIMQFEVFCNYKMGLILHFGNSLLFILYSAIIIFKCIKFTREYYPKYTCILSLILLPSFFVMSIESFMPMLVWKYSYYLIQTNGKFKFLFEFVNIIYLIAGIVAAVLIFQLMLLIEKARRKLSRKFFPFVSMVCYDLILKNALAYLFNDDLKKSFQLDKKYYYWNIIQNQNKYSIEEINEAYEKTLYLGSSLPKDFLLYQKIQIAYSDKKFKDVLTLCEEFKKEFKPNTSSYWLTVVSLQANIFKHQKQQKELIDIYDAIWENYSSKNIDINSDNNFITNIYIYPQKGFTSKNMEQKTNLLYILLAYYDRESLSDNKKYLFERANILFQLENYFDAEILYRQLINSNPINFDDLQRNVDEDIKNIKIPLKNAKQILATLKEKLDFNVKNLWLNMGICQYYNKNFEDAFNSFSKAIELDHKNKLLRYYRAITSLPAHKYLYKGVILDSFYSWQLKERMEKHKVFQ